MLIKEDMKKREQEKAVERGGGKGESVNKSTKGIRTKEGNSKE